MFPVRIGNDGVVKVALSFPQGVLQQIQQSLADPCQGGIRIDVGRIVAELGGTLYGFLVRVGISGERGFACLVGCQRIEHCDATILECFVGVGHLRLCACELSQQSLELSGVVALEVGHLRAQSAENRA